MARKCIASISLEAIKKNYLYAKSLAPQSQVIAVVKANAYGHGAVKVAHQLEGNADCFGVACSEEAQELRDSGITSTPILLMEGIFEESELALVSQLNLWIVVCNSLQVQWIINNQSNFKFNIFIKIDSGMGRLGFQEDEFLQVNQILEKSKNVQSITLMSHFSSADNINSNSTERQLSKFNALLGSNKNQASLANSAAIIARSDSHRDFIRPGIMLYGSSPFPYSENFKDLLPAMTLSSTVISIKHFKKGQTIGYGERFTCKKDTAIGVVAIGYADGYPRSAKDGAPVFINGCFAKLAGKVSMDMITIDLEGVKKPKIGDHVELFGNNVSVDELAKYSNTISYEIFSKITNRVYKTYVS
jgi:alanine racemase